MGCSAKKALADPEALAVRRELFDLQYGFVRTQALYVCVRLGLPDLIGSQPIADDELAAQVSADPLSLRRLLRFLASFGVFAEVEPGRFAATRLSGGLRTNTPLSLRDLVLMNGSELYRAWGEALYSIRTGRSAFEHVYGKSHFAYLDEHPAAAKTFNQAMASGVDAKVAPLLAYDWDGIDAVADIGGGTGSVLVQLLKTNQRLRGVVFDLPHAAGKARATIGEAALTDRCEFVAGDFFTDRLPAADVYVMAQILHDWDDAHAAPILDNCRRSLGDRGRLLLVEQILSDSPDRGILALDLQMLVILGGRERTETDWRTLLRAGGFDLQRIIPMNTPFNLIEATPA